MRTFVVVELESSKKQKAFSEAMTEHGFIRTVTGKKKRNALELPHGMYLIERTSPVEALELTRQALRQANARARVFCMPVGGEIRFADLKAADLKAA